MVAIRDHSYSLVSALLGLPQCARGEGELRRRAMELLEIFDLGDKRDTVAGSLPYGRQRMLEIARALATGMKVLLLDEPAAGMNPVETQELLRYIGRISREFRVAILLIEHDMSLVMNVCRRIQVINFGETIALGLPEEIACNKQVIRAYLGGDLAGGK
ncbi:MAG: ABC transporter ATP-binding protein, partial [Clostridia bacterium]|nr:ABC transporter ATP-binding protein [Clostridia bacterium]